MGHALDIAFEQINAVDFIPGHKFEWKAHLVDTSCNVDLGSVRATELALEDSTEWPFGVMAPP